jgi:hypothetical protein
MFPRLKRIINPDGTSNVTPDELQFYKENLAGEANIERLASFTKKVYKKYTDELESRQSKYLGQIVQTANGYGFSVVNVIPQFSMTAEEILSGTLDVRAALQDVIGKAILFQCAFRSGNIPHAFIVKKEETEDSIDYYIMDPHGIVPGSENSAFSEEQKKILENIFYDGMLHYSECQFQGSSGVCNLWSMLFLSHPEKKPEELLKIVKNTVQKLGLPPQYDSSDLVIIAIFALFLETGFATPEDEASYNGEFLQGLGRCRKCGLPKNGNRKRI